MILYHGSQQIVEAPEYGKGKETNDYGRGFYCTESLELAKEWACPIAKDGFANIYELDTDGLSVLKLNSEEYTILNWMALLMNYRQFDLSKNKQLGIQGRQYLIDNFTPDISEYDVITGYRADDRYFAFAKDFVQNVISIKQLSAAMEYGELGNQIVLKSKKAFSQIRFLGYEIADFSRYNTQRREREEKANTAYNELHKNANPVTGDLYMLDILREQIKNNDARLR